MTLKSELRKKLLGSNYTYIYLSLRGLLSDAMNDKLRIIVLIYFDLENIVFATTLVSL